MRSDLNVTDVPKMSTAPGGPWLAFLSERVELDEPFKSDEIPSCARREAVSQVAVRRVAEHLRAAGLPPAGTACSPTSTAVSDKGGPSRPISRGF